VAIRKYSMAMKGMLLKRKPALNKDGSTLCLESQISGEYLQIHTFHEVAEQFIKNLMLKCYHENPNTDMK
jgi:hypothetical protein